MGKVRQKTRDQAGIREKQGEGETGNKMEKGKHFTYTFMKRERVRQ